MTNRHDWYSDEVAGRLKSVRMSEIPATTEGERVAIETAYRRGYFQGYAAALESPSEDHLYNKLSKWRYCRHSGKFEPPPD
jgi:hypothetical protein